MYTSLSRGETWTYFLIWIGGLSFSVYQVYLTSAKSESYLGDEDLESGWLWVGRKKDISDYEWRIWVPFLWQLAPWLIIHHIIGEFLRWFQSEGTLRLWYFLVTAIFLVDYAGPGVFIALVIQPCSLLAVSYIGGRRAVWAMSLPIIISLNFYESDFLTEEQQINLSVCTAWLHLRSISFCMDHLNGKPWTQSERDKSPIILRLLSFTFYLPLMFLGPFVSYRNFEEGLSDQSMSSWLSLQQRVRRLLTNACRFLGWMFFTEWALHYVYCNALQSHHEILPFLNAWALNGLAYCIGQFFLNKYVVIYGLMGTLAQADGIRPPPVPRCIAHVSLYSDMWRHFDRGFYNFLTSYVYIPLLGHNKSVSKGSFQGVTHRLWCSVVSFAFVYVWHGLNTNILVWSIFNFVGLSLETAARNIGSTAEYRRWEEKLSARNIRRWRALVASPLFIMSALTMFYFLGNMEVGNIFILQVLHGSFRRNFLLLFFSYCMCQVSMEIKMTVFQRRPTKSDNY